MKRITEMSDQEFAEHHAKGLAQIERFGRNLDKFQRKVSTIQSRINDFDKKMESFKG